MIDAEAGTLENVVDLGVSQVRGLGMTGCCGVTHKLSSLGGLVRGIWQADKTTLVTVVMGRLPC